MFFYGLPYSSIYVYIFIYLLHISSLRYSGFLPYIFMHVDNIEVRGYARTGCFIPCGMGRRLPLPPPPSQGLAAGCRGDRFPRGLTAKPGEVQAYFRFFPLIRFPRGFLHRVLRKTVLTRGPEGSPNGDQRSPRQI